MTALAISVALVVIAFVARDVALRVLAERAAVRVSDARIDEITRRLDGFHTGTAARIKALETSHAELAAKVEKLLARDSLKGMGGR